MAEKNVRYHALDELRGLVFISMVLYHGMWDLVYMFGVDVPWYRSTVGYVWQQSICWTFILLSGFCQCLGRKKYRRAGIVFGAGLLVTAVTCLVLPEDRVVFGVLTFLGTASFVATVCSPLLSRCRPLPGFLISAFLFVLTRNVNSGFAGFEGWQFMKLPEGLYQNLGTAFFGFPPADFYSTDYFSFLPWIFLFLCGCFLGRFVLHAEPDGTLPGRQSGEHFMQKERIEYVSHGERVKQFLRKKRLPFLGFLGRHSLLFYLLHQPVLYVVLTFRMEVRGF